MQLYKIIGERSSTVDGICLHTYTAPINPIYVARIRYKYIDIILRHTHRNQSISSERDFSGVCGRCRSKFGFFSHYLSDFYTEKEVDVLNSILKKFGKFYHNGKCCVPPHLLSGSCRHRIYTPSYPPTDEHVPVRLDIRKIDVKNLKIGDIFFDPSFTDPFKNPRPVEHIIRNIRLKTPSTTHIGEEFYILNGLTMSDSYLHELNQAFDMDLTDWLNIKPLWYRELENSFEVTQNGAT